MPPRRVAFFRGDLIGKDEENDGFARGNLLPTLSEGSLLRVSEISAKRFGLGILLFGDSYGNVDEFVV